MLLDAIINPCRLNCSMLIKTIIIWKNVLVQNRLILKEQVIKDLHIFSIDRSEYKNLINEYCEQWHQKNGTPRTAICKIVVEELHGLINHENDWIRKRIDEKYKIPQRVQNGKLRSTHNRLAKIPLKINELEQTFAELTKQTIDYVRKE